MKSEDLYRELSNIDDRFIEECSVVEKKKEVHLMKNNTFKTFLKYGAIAVGFMVVIGGVVAVAGIGLNMINIGGARETATLIDVAIVGEAEQETFVVESKDLVYFGGNTYIQSKKEAIPGELLGVAEQGTEWGYSNYVGCNVYRMEGKKGKINLVVEKEGTFIAYKLWSWGYEPDMAGLMDMYGVFGAEDIESVLIEQNWDETESKYINEITLTWTKDKEAISALYNILTTLVLDKEGYDAIVDKLAAEDFAEWKANGGGQVYEDETGKYVGGYSGTKAFDNHTNIKIKTVDGDEFMKSYYPKIGYMSFFKATDELVNWLQNYF